MKIILAEICIWILRKLQIGCIIGMKIENAIVVNRYQRTYWYDNILTDSKVFDQFNNEIEIPLNQPFRIETFKSEEGI